MCFVSTLVFAGCSDVVVCLYGTPNIGYFWSKPRLAHSPYGFDNASGSFLVGLVRAHSINPKGLSKACHLFPQGRVLVVISVNDVFTSVEGL
jgi:hypothetical protein